MNDAFSLSKAVKYLAPFLLSLLLILLNAVPAYPLTGFMHAIPMVLVVIFYFAIFNPKLLNSIVVFILAIFADLLVEGPFGLLIITYVLMFFIGNFLRTYLYNLTFFRLWGVFCVFLSLIEGLQYLLFCLLAGQMVPVGSWIVTSIALMLIYPFVMRLCVALDLYTREAA